MGLHIALLEDDPAQAELMLDWLKSAGYECRHFSEGRAFLKSVLRESYDLLVIDWELPDITGHDVLVEVRASLDWPIPVLFVTNRDSETDIVSALEAGADDYIIKPARQAETLARVRALGRRSQPADEDTKQWDFPPFSFDSVNHVARREGVEVDLTPREFELSLFLFRHAGRALSRTYLMERIWGTSAELNTRTVDTHVSRLRSKLGIHPETGWRLTSVYLYGYRLEQLSSTE